MDNFLNQFIRISVYRMCEHYLPKLKIALNDVDKDILWKHEKQTLNSIGGIVLHIGEHIQRHVVRYSNASNTEGGIENYFPDKETLNANELLDFISGRFSSWRRLMNDYLNEKRNPNHLDMFDIYHLVEHTGYHLGQIIDRVQRLTDRNFHFVQNGVNEKSLKDFISRE